MKMILKFILIFSIIETSLSLNRDWISVRITSQNNNLPFKEGESVILTCEISSTQNDYINYRNLIIQWTLNNKTIHEYNDHHILNIPNAIFSNDFGEYRCLVKTNETSFVQSDVYFLNIYWISKYAQIVYSKYSKTIEEMDDYLNQHTKKLSKEPINTFKIGDKLVLRCDASGYPDLQIDWYLNGDLLVAFNDQSTKNKYTFEQNNLFINVIDTSVHGVYSCNAQNTVGQLFSRNSFVLAVELASENDISYSILQSISNETTVKQNSNVNIYCIFTNYDYLNWYLFPSNRSLINSTNTIVWPNGTLSLFNFGNTNEGTYKCVAFKQNANITYSVRIKLAFLDDFHENSILALYNSFVNNTIIIPKNNRFKLYCLPPRGYPIPNIYWMYFNDKIISNEGIIHMNENNQLIFENPDFNQSGLYKCVAENQAAKHVKAFKVHVANKAILEAENQIHKIITKENQNITLKCLKSDKLTSYSINWYHNGTLLFKNTELKNRNSKKYTINKNNFDLTINSLDLVDNGYYVCQINQTGFKLNFNSGYRLKVNEKLKFLVALSNQKLELGKLNKVHCKIRAEISFHVKWLRGNAFDLGLKTTELNKYVIEELKQRPSLNNEYIKDENGVLLFKKMRKEDEGFYTCFAFTGEDQIYVSIRVDSVTLPKFIIKPNPEIFVEQNQTLILTCQADGDPTPSINWDKNNDLNLINTNSRTTILSNGSLIITNISLIDEGIYGCTAGNAGGFNRAESRIQIKNFNRNYQYMDNLNYDMTYNFKTQKTVAIAVGIALIYIFIILGLLMWFRHKKLANSCLLTNDTLNESQPKTQHNTNLDTLNRCMPLLDNNLELKDNKQRSNYILNEKFSLNNTETVSVISSTVSASYESNKSKKNYRRNKLTTVMLLGHGEFGEVYLAKSTNSKKNDVESIVMVKSLQTDDDMLIKDFFTEINMYKQLNHEKIVKLLNVFCEKEPKLMIIEYSDWGDLKQFLLATRIDKNKSTPSLINPDPLSNLQILDIAYQVASGMVHLSNMNFVHKDLATRNCLISSKLQIKISSCSLSKNTYSKEYILYRNRDLSIRWLPNESIFENKWSVKSDVWSFSVLFWELCTSADLPFADKRDDEVFNLLKCNQLRVNYDEFIWLNENLHIFLTKCLENEVVKRPDFNEIHQTLLNEMKFY